MIMKTLVSVLVSAGVAGLIFSVMAYLELHDAATSAMSPSPDAMYFTNWVGPEMFDPAMAGTRPAELAAVVFRRIYMVAGGSIILLIIAALLLLKKASAPKSSSADKPA